MDFVFKTILFENEFLKPIFKQAYPIILMAIWAFYVLVLSSPSISIKQRVEGCEKTLKPQKLTTTLHTRGDRRGTTITKRTQFINRISWNILLVVLSTEIENSWKHTRLRTSWNRYIYKSEKGKWKIWICGQCWSIFLGGCWK